MITTTDLENIADELAENAFSVVDNFIPETDVDAILQLDDFKAISLHFAKAGIGKSQEKQVNEAIRGDYIRWIERYAAPPPLRLYFEQLDRLMTYLNRSLFLSLKDTEIHLTCYPPGAFYKRHLDQFRFDDHRKLSIITYLNPNWQETFGGQLRMYTQGGHRDILPVAGRMVCFRSDLIEHEVLPATRDRLSITGWLLDTLTDTPDPI